MTIVIKDLEVNIELDKEAMKSILGGWKNSPASASKLLSPRRSSKFNIQQLLLNRSSRNIRQN